MDGHSRWEEVKRKRPEPTRHTRAAIERELGLDEQAYGLRDRNGPDAVPRGADEA